MLQLYNWANNLFWRPTGAIGIARWHFLVTHSRALASLALPLSLCHSRSIYLSLLVSLHILATRARARACSTGTRRRARAALARALDRKCETPVAAKLNVQLIDGGARTHALPACRARFYFRVMFCAWSRASCSRNARMRPASRSYCGLLCLRVYVCVCVWQSRIYRIAIEVGYPNSSSGYCSNERASVLSKSRANFKAKHEHSHMGGCVCGGEEAEGGPMWAANFAHFPRHTKSRRVHARMCVADGSFALACDEY